MAGVVPIIPPRTGLASAVVDINIDKFIPLNEIVKHLPTINEFLTEITKNGWRYLFIDGYGTGLWELEIPLSPYKFQTDQHPRGGFAYSLAIDCGRRLPPMGLKSIIELQRFIINISTQYHPRAVTLDMIAKEITYVHDSLWVFKGKGYAEEAKSVLKILQWLIEKKKFKFGESKGLAKYHELANLLGESLKKR